MQAPSESRKIALFGGTFDPVHRGHLHLAGLAREALALDEIRFLPCRISPHKTGSQPTSPADRFRMLELATADLPWATIDDYELRHPGPSFSYQTAEAMAARFPSDRLFWIMGGDQWLALPLWKNPDILARHVEFIVLARGAPIMPREGHRLHVIHGDHPASSTAVRQAARDGSTDLPWLPASVASHIRENGLYAS